MPCFIARALPRLAVVLALSAGAAANASASAAATEHREFEATLHAPFKADPRLGADAAEARTFTLTFEYPFIEREHEVSWRVELLGPGGQVLRLWHGAERLLRRPVSVAVRWDGRAERPLAAGIYRVRMQAVAREAAGTASQAGEALDPLEPVVQAWDIAVGQLRASAMPAFAPLPSAKGAKGANGATAGQPMAPAAAALPYTVYLANLHSQTNHSDGGADLGACGGAQAPQSAPFGPADAYAFARARGLDILATSEHNHMYDGSEGSDAAGSAAAARALYRSGLAAAAGFSAAHPDFLAVYGLEWGVINKGGHLNIFNSPDLLGWERDGSGELMGDTLTAKGDYPALYALMRERGWVGQFNHPSWSGQFMVNGVPLGYSQDGDQAMALCEVLNSSAFSSNTSETETRRSNYEIACNKALEAGFHVAFSSNQDNHCANWGASYTNRTGVLIPAGTALSQASFIEALKARRVFATMDKESQLVLTANGRLMGERFANSGPLTLSANFASTAGKTVASVAMFEGVPGRNGSVSVLSDTALTTFTPAPGEHFYYARLTQSDGNILWSAPVWVSQSETAGDSTPPAVAAAVAAVSPTSGIVTLTAEASDNVGVARVEFYVDGVLKAGSEAAPYAARIDGDELGAGWHSLTATAVDAAGNSTTSKTLVFEAGPSTR